MLRRSWIYPALVIGLILPLFATTWQAFRLQETLLEDSFRDNARQVARYVADGMTDPIWNLIPESGAPLAESVVDGSRVLRLDVLSGAQGPFLTVGVPPPANTDVLVLEEPVRRDGEAIGLVRLTVNAAYPDDVLATHRRGVLIAAGVSLAFAIGLLTVLLRLYRKDLAAQAVHSTNQRLAQEIDERRRAEAALAESEARFRDFTQIASDWTWESDADHRFTLFVANRPLGSSRDGRTTVIGATRWEVAGVDPEADPHWQAHLDDMNERREYRGFEYAVIRDGAAVRHVRANGRPIFGPDGAFLGYRGVSTDITRLKTMEQELRKAKERAEAANDAKAVFLAHMSHDLRTPLNAIIGFAEVMELETFGPLGGPRYVEYTRDILASGRYLLDLVNDILDVSLIESGGLNMTLEACDLNAMVKEAVARAAHTATRRSVSLVNAVPDELPPALADSKGVRQIMANLLDNALKFTPSGGEIRIEGAAKGDGEIALAVADNGRGMTEAEVTSATSPFTTYADGEIPDMHHRGAGLGLAIVKGVVEAMDGRLHIESAPGQGARISLTFRASPTA